MKLENVLCRTEETEINLERYPADRLKKIAGFWVGKEATKFRKDECIKALKKVFKDHKAARAAAESLPAKDQTIVGIFRRFGPTVSGAVLSAELTARGLTDPKEKPQRPYYGSYGSKRNKRVSALNEKLILVSERGYRTYYFGSSYSPRLPELTLHPQLRGAIPLAPPIVWKPSEKPPRVQSGGFRSSAEVALEFWQVAEALQAMGNWQTLSGGSLAKGSRNRLRKRVAFPSAEEQPTALPDQECFLFDLLREMEFLDISSSEVDWPALQTFLDEPIASQARQWVRAWMDAVFWQDGIGVVSNRENQYDPDRIEIGDRFKGQELLVWALSAVAQTQNDWLDLETFFCDLFQATRDDPLRLVCYGFTWQPDFLRCRNKIKTKGEERDLANWLEDNGRWAANALWVTLWTLGLIERGHTNNKAARPCFRLTELGLQVFGAPEREIPEKPATSPCLMVQPNCEVVAYLEEADAGQVSMLARFADPSSAGGPVQTMTLSRKSVYRGLESGLSAEAIQAFLAEHSKTPVPENVQKSLSEWAGKRESLTLRTGVSLLIAPKKTDYPRQSPRQDVAESFSLLPAISPAQAKKNYAGWTIQNHKGPLAKVWTVGEQGELKTTGSDPLSRARLAMLAEKNGQEWQITEAAVARAKNQGITADQMLGWLADHLNHETPPLLETAIRSWTGRLSAFLGPVHLLQVTRPQARDAILKSPTFQALLAGHIPPDWFLVEKSRLAEVKRLLKHLGIRLTETYQLPDPAPESPPPSKSKKPRRKRRSRNRA